MSRPTGRVSRSGEFLVVEVDDAAVLDSVFEAVRYVDHERAIDRVALLVPRSAAPALREALDTYPASKVSWQWDRDADDAEDTERALVEQLHTVLSTPVELQAVWPDGADLQATGFHRELRSFQVRDLARLLRMENGANFSVPGSGKTTVTYALFALLRHAGIVDIMAVVAPSSAFEAWEVEARDCFQPHRRPDVDVRPGVIRRHVDVAVLNYERLERDRRLADLDEWFSGRRALVVFDEAHRAKAGRRGVRGRAARTLADRATRRLVLTGTPMPNGYRDLAAVFDLAWPGEGERLSTGDLASRRSRAFVRVVKGELELPPLDVDVEYVDLEPAHRRVYEALAGSATSVLRSRAASDAAIIGRAIMRLIAAATNPAVVLDRTSDFVMPADESSADLASIMSDPGAHVRPSKFVRVKQHVESNVAQGQKTLVWSNFVGNVRALQASLADHHPAVVVGATPVADPSAPTDRRRELERFRSDPACEVLIATPQTLGEGVSLHRACQRQVHVDRGFAAGTYLQSLDRTHRLGMPEGVPATCTLLVSRNTIDEHVHAVLGRKVAAMSAALQDESLNAVADPTSERDLSIVDLLLGSGDAAALAELLRSVVR